jgi:hypothetical protein
MRPVWMNSWLLFTLLVCVPESCIRAPDVQASSSVGRCLSVLSSLTKYAPQLPALGLLAARGHVINGAQSTALQQLNVLTRKRPGDAEARLMQVRSHQTRGHTVDRQPSTSLTLSMQARYKSGDVQSNSDNSDLI